MLLTNIYDEGKMPTLLLRIWYAFRKDIFAMIGFYGVTVLLLLCVFGESLAPYDPQEPFSKYQLLPPAWSEYGNVSFFLGTDALGRDILSRILAGTALTFGAAVIIMLAAIFFGCILGGLAGIQRGIFAILLQHILDILLAIPVFLLAIIIVVYLGTGLLQVMFAVWLTLLPRSIYIVYHAVRQELDKTHINAARLDGISTPYLLLYAVLPNIASVLVTEFTCILSLAILDITALGFLDLGVQAPFPEWGSLLGNALDLFYIAPWTVFFPGCMIAISILFINLLGEGVCRAIVAGLYD